MANKKVLLGLLGAILFSATAWAQESDPMPYDILDDWIEPFAGEGFIWGGSSGVHVQSKDRIFILQRGETQLPNPPPPEYTDFAGSMGWNVLRGRGRVWQNCIYVINSEGEVLEVWDQWDHLFTGTDGPGPHRIRISPYDPEKRLWLIDETGHIIYVFSNDGEQLLMTFGEKNIPGTDNIHYRAPQDVAFLPDGKFIVADGLANTRVVVRNADGSYHSEFGEEGDAPGQFASVHSIAFGPGDRLYTLDRDNRRIQMFQQTADKNSPSYPSYEYVKGWGDFGMPLDITVTDQSIWVTALNPVKIVQFDLEGNQEYLFHLPDEGPVRWIEMHSLSVDDDGNLYGTDNQLGRIQKLVPRADANPANIVGKPYIPR